jgi:hypothetical protein
MWFAQCIVQKPMACITYAAYIDPTFGDRACKFLDFGVGVCPGDFARQRFHLLAPSWIGTDGQAQPVAKCVPRSANAALRGFRAGACRRVCTVRPDLAGTGQDRLLGSADFSLMVRYWASSIC